MLRILLADDERIARTRLRRLLDAIGDLEIVAECANGEDALEQLDRHEIDVALLDVQMGALSGLDVAELAAELGAFVIFTTAHREHAVAAFERGAVDYVVKPIEQARLETAITRARRRVEAERAERISVQQGERAESLALRVRGAVRMVRCDAISHAVHDGELVTVWAGEPLLTELSLAELERRTLGSGLERVHRRALLSLAHVDRLEPLPTGGYRAVTRSGHEVPVSRQAARVLRRRIP